MSVSMNLDDFVFRSIWMVSILIIGAHSENVVTRFHTSMMFTVNFIDRAYNRNLFRLFVIGQRTYYLPLSCAFFKINASTIRYIGKY